MDDSTPLKLHAFKVDSPGTTTVKLSKKFTRTMDIGYVQFEVTLRSMTLWGKEGHALIQFPNYYSPKIGVGVKCQLIEASGTAHDLSCSSPWDWTLKVSGPKDKTMTKDNKFFIKIDGVTMNNPNTEQNFQIGFSDKTDIESVSEFGLFEDNLMTHGAWSTLKPLEVLSIVYKTKHVRSRTEIVVRFTVPVTQTGALTNGEYIAMTLPWEWGQTLTEVGWAGQVQIQKETPTGIKTVIGSTPIGFSGSTIVAKIDAYSTTWVEGTNYTLTITNVPTPQ